MNWETKKQYNEEIATITERNGKMLTAAHEKGVDLTAEERQEFDRGYAEVDKLRERIELCDKQAEMESTIVRHFTEPRLDRQDNNEDRAKKITEKFILTGELEPEERSYMAQYRDANVGLDVGQTSGGKEWLAPQYVKEIVQKFNYVGGMRKSCTVIESPTTSPWVYFGGDETNAEGEEVSSVANDSSDDVSDDTVDTYQTLITPVQFSSKNVKVSLSQLNNNASGITDFLSTALANRVARTQNKKWTTDASVGIIKVCDVGKTTASYSEVTYPEWVDFTESLDYLYSQDFNNCQIQMTQPTRALLRKLVDDNHRPLYSNDNLNGNIEKFADYQIVINPHMEDIGSGKVIAALGNFKAGYVIADYLGGGQLWRFWDSNTAKNFCVEFLYGQISGGNCINKNAIKLLKMGTSS
jgi:HK97 family phage major capsid protein